MGTNVGNVSVRFSAQDQEVVRKALEQLGRDADAALRKLDTAGKPVSLDLTASAIFTTNRVATRRTGGGDGSAYPIC